eukprot:COSAG01_NODE_31758_length_591_cov_128.861789_1_plen_45_part_01
MHMPQHRLVQRDLNMIRMKPPSDETTSARLPASWSIVKSSSLPIY